MPILLRHGSRANHREAAVGLWTFPGTPTHPDPPHRRPVSGPRSLKTSPSRTPWAFFVWLVVLASYGSVRPQSPLSRTFLLIQWSPAVFGFRRPPPVRHVSEESKESLRLWEFVLVSGSPLRCLRLPPTFPVEAFADACTSEHAAGLGGFVRLSSGQCLYFQHQFTPPALLPLCPWMQEGESLQSYICCWELLAQCSLLLLLHRFLPPGHPPVHVLFRWDNATVEAASWKGCRRPTASATFSGVSCVSRNGTRLHDRGPFRRFLPRYPV